MGKRHPPYPPEFREEAVRLVRDEKMSMRAAAVDLGCSVESIRWWLRQSDIDAGDREGLTSEERVELARLRRENQILRQEREILKKAAAWFAKETDSTP